MAQDLHRLYQDARSALKARQYGRAAELLREVLIADENYKDASRLLAQAVRLKRRRWYQAPWLWAGAGLIALVGVMVFAIPRLGRLYATPAPLSTAAPTLAPAVANIQTPQPTTTIEVPPPTAIPLSWKRISIGQEFARDAVTAFATDKKDLAVIYAGMKNAGVYKTIDGGLSWRPAHHGLTNTQVDSLQIDAQAAHVLYAGTLDGAFKTEDGGENWQRIGAGSHLLMDMQDSSHLYTRDESGIYETWDRGRTWTVAYALKNDCPDSVGSWAIHPGDGRTLFLGGGETCAGVYQSDDRGHTWRRIGLEDKPNLLGVSIRFEGQGQFSVSARFESPTVWADSDTYVTHDGGHTWVRGGCSDAAFDPEFPATVYCPGSRLEVLREGSGVLEVIPETQSLEKSALHVDHIGDTDRILMGATDVRSETAPYVGIFMSNDGGETWTRHDNGLGSTRLELVADPVDDSRLYVGAYLSGYLQNWDCILYRSTDGGNSWKSIRTQGTWCGPTFDAAGVIYMAELGSLQQSGDSGGTWAWDRQDHLGPRLPSTTISGAQVQSLWANPSLKGVVFDVGDRIRYSADAGVTWTPGTGSEGSWDARLFYADQGRTMYSIGRYHEAYSDDSGKTWTDCGEDASTSRSDSRLALDPPGSRLYLATPGRGVLVSEDRCQSWKAGNEGLSNLFVNTVALEPGKPDTVYAGTDGGAYVSFDNGHTWGEISSGLLGANVVYSIAVSRAGGVFAATPYGVFKLEGQ